MNKTGVTAIVVGAGSGRRMGLDKAFMKLGSRPLIAWPVEVLQRCAQIDEIILVVQEKKIDEIKELASEYKWTKLKNVCAGGELRQDSVRNGLKHVHGSKWVLIQDAARPFLTDKLITDGLAAAVKKGSAVAAVEVKDTIKVCDRGDIVVMTPERRTLRAVQTPQVFRLDIINEAYGKAVNEVTDDASLVERAGYQVQLYAGDYENIKITTPEDMMSAEMIARKRGML